MIDSEYIGQQVIHFYYKFAPYTLQLRKLYSDASLSLTLSTVYKPLS